MAKLRHVSTAEIAAGEIAGDCARLLPWGRDTNSGIFLDRFSAKKSRKFQAVGNIS